MNSCTFTDSRLVDFPQANPFLAKLLQRYDLTIGEAPQPASLVTLRIDLPQGSALLWDRATSLPRGKVRRHLLRSVSLALQESLRCWIPYLWLSIPAHWEDRDLLWPMLIYASSRTFKPVSRQVYSFDLLSEGTLPSILRSSLPVLREWMPLLLAINHNRPAARREFRTPRLLNVIEKMDFDPHPLKRLLSHEQKLIGVFTDLADGLAEPRGFDYFGAQLHRHLNRIYTNVDFSFLAPLMHVEAENMLAIHLLGQPIRQARLQVAAPPPGAVQRRLPRPGFAYHQARASLRQPNPGSSVQSL